MKTKIKKNKISRRNFLTASAAASCTVFLSPKLMAAPTPNSTKNFVLIFLRGGHDGLSAVGPHLSNVNIGAKRPDIQFPMANNAKDPYFGINTELTELISLYNTGDLAIVHGVGGKNETTSHFAQMDYIESGHSGKILPEGFLARFAKHLNSDAYALETIMPRSLRSADKFVMQFTDKANLKAIARRPNQDLSISRNQFLSGFFSGATFGIIKDKANTLSIKADDVNAKLAMPANISSGYESKEIGLLAELLAKSNNGVYTISHGGWDHHRTLKTFFTDKCQSLFSDLNKLRNDLKVAGKWDNTTIVVMSEFGRRIGQNGSLGCDHGRGGVSYILGGKVAGRKIYRTENYDNLLTSKINTPEAGSPKECLPVEIDARLIFAEVFSSVYGIKNGTALNKIFSYDASTSTIGDPIAGVVSKRLGFIKA